MAIAFGDNVQVLPSEETSKLGLSGKKGQVYGETTPSVTKVEVIGKTVKDHAVNVYFEDLKKDYWFSENLLTFLDHGAGTEIVIGDKRSTRQADGKWSAVKSTKKWWEFWK